MAQATEINTTKPSEAMAGDDRALVDAVNEWERVRYEVNNNLPVFPTVRARDDYANGQVDLMSDIAASIAKMPAKTQQGKMAKIKYLRMEHAESGYLVDFKQADAILLSLFADVEAQII